MANRRGARWRRKGNESGATLVELAVGLMVFLVLVMGVIEFGYALFNWARMAEATRAGVRTAIVNDPEADLSTLYAECGDGAPEPVEVEADPDGPVFTTMQRIFPPLKEEGGVWVTYACSEAGSPQRPQPILAVTVETSGVQHDLITPQLLGLDTTWTIPAFASTRTSEDLETQETEG